MATRDFAPEKPEHIPLRFGWTTAESLSKHEILKYLCSLGSQTHGGACRDCVSQCAFGKKYIGEHNVDKPKNRSCIGHRTRILRAYMPDGSQAGTWLTLKEAQRSMGYKSSTMIRRSIANGVTHKGIRWVWEDAENA